MAVPAVEAIRKETSELSLAKRHLGLWTNRGVADASCALHSTGMTYWNLMGTMFGFDAITEMPAPTQGAYGYVGDDVRTIQPGSRREQILRLSLLSSSDTQGNQMKGKSPER